MKFFTILSLLIFLSIGFVQAQSHTYECRRENGHVIHIITLQPSKYTINFIKAHDQVFGRETIESIAKRTGADIAINAGFFEIGNSQDGMPSGTLIIDKQILGLSLQKQACLICDQTTFKIQSIHPRLEIKIGENTLSPQKVNKFPSKKDIILYSCSWGTRTLTPLKERQEIAIDEHNKVVEFSKQGNIAVPQNGFVLSLPIDYSLQPIAKGSEAILHLNPPCLLPSERKSVVMGIPILIHEGNINPALHENQTHFYQSAHARTAVGLRSNGDVVLVVAEHIYQKPLQGITLEEIKSILLANQTILVKKYKKPILTSLTLAELKEIITQEFTNKDAATGLTLLELATLMKSLNCKAAINLDGGGSSSLFLNGHVINQTTGDQDEKLGQTTLRPLSDAIVFKPAL